MTKKARSAKGVMVDFDLLKIKEQIASDPAPMDVKARQDHIDQRLRRRLRKIKTSTPSTATISVEQSLPSAKQTEQTETLIDETPKTKQKARRKKNT